MSDARTTLLRFTVLALAGYLSLATTPPPMWYAESAHVDILFDVAPKTVRLRVSADAESVTFVAPEAVSIASSSGSTAPAEHCGWTPGFFCEDVPFGSATIEYDLTLIAAVGQTARVEVIAGGYAHRVDAQGGKLGVRIGVLP